MRPLLAASLRGKPGPRPRILRAAAGDGLLTLDEADERLGVVYAARFRDELGPVTADLPHAGTRLLENTPEARAAARVGFVRHVVTVAVVAALQQH